MSQRSHSTTYRLTDKEVPLVLGQRQLTLGRYSRNCNYLFFSKTELSPKKGWGVGTVLLATETRAVGEGESWH